MIAIALAADPDLLIADEPTTAVDVTIQAQLLALLQRLQEQMNMAMLFITHDLGVVAKICDRVTVLHSGRAVEDGSVSEIIEQPQHDYTRALMKATPRYDRPGVTVAGTGSHLRRIRHRQGTRGTTDSRLRAKGGRAVCAGELWCDSG